MPILSTVALVFLVGNTPIPHIQIVDMFQDASTCLQVIETVTRQEVSEPESERIAPLLKCIRMSTKERVDADGPTKPVLPNRPMIHTNKNETFDCYNMLKTPVVCRNTTFKLYY